jgi:hypothetical protein
MSARVFKLYIRGGFVGTSSGCERHLVRENEKEHEAQEQKQYGEEEKQHLFGLERIDLLLDADDQRARRAERMVPFRIVRLDLVLVIRVDVFEFPGLLVQIAEEDAKIVDGLTARISVRIDVALVPFPRGVRVRVGIERWRKSGGCRG